MNAMNRRLNRQNQILVVVEEMRADSEDGHGVDPHNFDVSEVYEVITDCTSLQYLTDVEKRLAVVAFEEGTAAAKKSIWYN